MKKLLLLAAIALSASVSASATHECNPWAKSTPTEKTAVKTEKQPAAEVKNDARQSEPKQNAHIQAHLKAISNQRPQK